MNNDFAKSILDNPYNRVEDGQKVTLMDILLKYDHQRIGEKFELYDAYADDLGITKEDALAYQNCSDSDLTGQGENP